MTLRNRLGTYAVLALVGLGGESLAYGQMSVVLHTGQNSGPQRGERAQGRGGRQRGAGAEHLSVTPILDAQGNPTDHGVVTGQISYTDTPNYYTGGTGIQNTVQVGAAEFVVDAQSNIQVTTPLGVMANLDGDRKRQNVGQLIPFTNGIAAYQPGGENQAIGLLVINYAPNNHTQAWGYVVGAGLKRLSPMVQLVAAQNSNGPERNVREFGSSAVQELGVVGNTHIIGGGWQFNGNNIDDTLGVVFKVTKTGGTGQNAYQITNTINVNKGNIGQTPNATILENDIERFRGSSLVRDNPAGGFDIWHCGTDGDNQNPKGGGVCSLSHVDAQGNTIKKVNEWTIAKPITGQGAGNIYPVNVQIVAGPTADTAYISYNTVQKLGRRKGGKKTTENQIMMVKLTPQGPQVLQQATEGLTTVLDSMHRTTCGANGMLIQAANSSNGSENSVAVATAIRWDNNALVAGEQFPIGLAGDSADRPNYLGQNPKTQGMAMYGCQQFGNTLVYASAPRFAGENGQLEPKLAATLNAVPMAQVQQAAFEGSNFGTGDSGGTGGGDIVGCNTAPASSSTLTLLMLGVAFAISARRRRQC